MEDEKRVLPPLQQKLSGLSMWHLRLIWKGFLLSKAREKQTRAAVRGVQRIVLLSSLI